MNSAKDPLGVASDPELQVSTLNAGWSFYLRHQGETEGALALYGWFSAIEATLDLEMVPRAQLELTEEHLRGLPSSDKQQKLLNRIEEL